VSLLSRWALVVRGRLAAGDVLRDGTVPEAVVARLVRDGCDAYLGLVESLAGSGVTPLVTVGRVRPLEVGSARTLLVAASATEVFPDAFTVSVRLRPLGDGSAGDFACRVVPGGPLPEAVREELIAIEKAATRTA
jgi:hypothetical protein